MKDSEDFNTQIIRSIEDPIRIAIDRNPADISLYDSVHLRICGDSAENVADAMGKANSGTESICFVSNQILRQIPLAPRLV